MSTNRPQVSISIPVYNGERYLKRTLDSILCQTYPDFELIISDNCSTDNTQRICEEYTARDKRIKYYRNVTNLGIAPNYNRAFELSTGKYFKWADYDDMLGPEFISKCVEILDQHPDVACCYPRTTFIDETDKFIGNFNPPKNSSSPSAHIRFRSLILDPDHIVSQASGLMRADLVRKTILHGSYPCSDEVFLAHLSLLGEFYEVPDRLFFYRIHPLQSTKGVKASERARVKSFDSSLEGKVILIKWLYLKNCLLAISHSPILAYQKIMCFLYMIRWLFIVKNFRSISKDLLLAIHEKIHIFPKVYKSAKDAAS
jgi:glycosyltransferase involved in cell wall biosynthesis